MAEQFIEKKQVPETEHIALPKNIRQIGTPGERQKIYIEDYVYTYLHTFLKEKYKGDTLKAALLLGEYRRQDDTTYSFVKGAISCDFSHLREEISEELAQAMDEYFPEWEMLGWYVSAQGVDAHIQSEIKHYYAGSDAKIPHYLIYEDELEKEIDVFAWEQNALHKLMGYYIYYERNPQMQEFLIKEKGGRPQETPTFRVSDAVSCSSEQIERESFNKYKEEKQHHRNVQTKDLNQEIKKNIAALNSQTQHTTKKEIPSRSVVRKPQRLVYAACAVVLILLAAMGVTQIGNYQNLQQLQEAISSTVIPAKETGDGSSEKQEESAADDQMQTEDLSADPNDDADVLQQPSNQQSENDAAVSAGTTPSDETEAVGAEGENAASSQNDAPDERITPEYYVVQKGDSLFSISRALYENEDMVDAICNLNGITNVNLIYEGQKLKLP